MSSTAPANDGGNARVKEESPELEDERTLLIKTSAETGLDLKLVFVPLFGASPTESPVWQDMTHMDMDIRGLNGYTVRYEGKASPFSAYDYAAVRQAIWRRVQQLLPDDQLSHLISVAFDVDEGLMDDDDDDDRIATIDLVFDGTKALVKVVEGLDGIQVKDRHSVLHRFYRSAMTLKLPGSILLLDCHNLPIDGLDAEALFNALQAALQAAGSLLGFGKLVTASKRWKIQSQSTGLARLYLQLHEENLSTPWQEFVDLLPTHLKINGVVYSLYYCGRHLHTEDVISPNFTVAKIDEAEAEGSATKQHRAAPSDESSSTASKRRRSSE